MTTDPAGAAAHAPAIPEWTLGWRLQRSLAHAGMRVEDMAQELEVSRATISRWLNDRGGARKIYLRQWALRTGVPFEWIENGVVPDDTALVRESARTSGSGSVTARDTVRYLGRTSARGRTAGQVIALPARHRHVSVTEADTDDAEPLAATRSGGGWTEHSAVSA